MTKVLYLVILIAENIHLGSKKEGVISLITEYPCLSNVFWEVRLNIDTWKYTLTLWLNSTFGLMLYLAFAINSVGDDFIMKKGNLQSLLVIDPGYIPSATSKAIFNALKTHTLLNFRKEFELACKKLGVRKQIDDFFIKVLNLNVNLAPYYEMLILKNRFLLYKGFKMHEWHRKDFRGYTFRIFKSLNNTSKEVTWNSLLFS